MLVIQGFWATVIYFEKSFRMSVEDLVIGPLVFATDIPVILTHKIREELQADFGNLNRALLTEISLTYGRFDQQLDKISKYRKLIQKYQFLRLTHLNCAHNRIPTFLHFECFRLPQLDTLDLSDCYIESLEGLNRCQFPHLASLKLSVNNHIVSMGTLRKLIAPFLSELVIDSNSIVELSGVSQISSIYLCNLEIQNNEILTVKPLAKTNWPNLSESRLENPNASIEADWNFTVEIIFPRKFPSLNA